MSGKNKLLRNCLQKRWEAGIVLIFAFFYYASYYQYGLNLGGEGGTAGVIALRLLEGQRPIADTFIGYNVLWFYPIAWLFQIFGPHYLILKIYFFLISTSTALLATFFIRRAVGGGFILPAATGILLVMIPGMQFRNYMAFLGVLNVVTLSQVFVFSQNALWKERLWRVLAGLALGITYLIRIDIGIFMSILAVGLFLAFPLSTELRFREGIFLGFKSILTIAVFALAIHFPVLWDARQRGFHDYFVGQYASWLNEIQNRATLILKDGFPRPIPLTPTKDAALKMQVSLPAPIEPAAASSAELLVPPAIADSSLLSRVPLSDLLDRKPSPRMFAWALYLPIPIALWIAIGIGVFLFRSIFIRNFEECQRALGVLIALGGALAFFPQYFFFRPDTPHLSEFMVPFLVAMVLACSYAVGVVQTNRRTISVVYAVVLLFLCTLDVAAHISNGLRRESSGSIAARNHCNKEFRALNGVHVFVRERDLPILQGLYSTIIAHSKPMDWVVCYPYFPTINFMTNRRSYEFNLYVDNATRSENFDEMTIKKMLCFQPAVVVIGHNALNKNESSRFKNWAAPTYEFIKNYYQLVATYGIYEIFIPKEKIGSQEIDPNSKLAH